MKTFKSPWYRLMFLVALVFAAAVSLPADAVTATAGVIVGLPSALPATQEVVHASLLAALGLAFAMPLQAFIEHAIAEQPWMNGVMRIFKPLLPSLLSGALGWISTRFGVSPMDAMTVAAALTGGAHLVNETGLASEAPEFKAASA